MYYFNTKTEHTVVSSQYTIIDNSENLVDKRFRGPFKFIRFFNIKRLNKNTFLLEELIMSYRTMSDIIDVCETNKSCNIKF